MRSAAALMSVICMTFNIAEDRAVNADARPRRSPYDTAVFVR